MAAPAQTRPASNTPYGILAGALLGLADVLLHPITILVYFVAELGGTNRQIAAIVTVGLLSWLLPRLVMPWVMTGSARNMPWALGASLVRAAAAIFLAYVGYRDGLGDEERLRSFFICFGAYSLASGFAHLPVTTLVARAAPGSGAQRAEAWRGALGALFVLGASAVAPRVFGVDGPDFPRNAALFFIAAAAATSAATFFVARLREPAAPATSADAPLRGADLLRVLGDGPYRRFALFGAIVAISTLADPFLLIYARQELDLPDDWMGRVFAVFALGLVLSGPVWGWMVRSTGARATMQLAVAIRVVVPLILVFLPYLISSEEFLSRVDSLDPVYWMTVAPFALLGVALRGYAIGNAEYVATMTVPARRAAYGVMVLLPMAVAAVAPLLAVEALDRWSFERLLLGSLCAGFLAVVASGLLVNATRRTRPTSQAWRLDRASS